MLEKYGQINFQKLNGRGINRLIMCKVGNGNDIRFWIGNWAGDLPFSERWPHLFGLELFKTFRVAEQIVAGQRNSILTWQWSRQPASEEEIKEWKECKETLSSVRLSNDKDTWIWIIDSQKGFSVKSVKKTLIIDRGTSHLPNFAWCKWVPIKCNIMAWRGNMDRLPTRINLRRRNVEITSVKCPSCDDSEETMEHLFTACPVAFRVWSAFSVWCNVPPLFFFEFKDILDIKYIKIGKKADMVTYGLVIITCWCIWKERNEVVFNKKVGSALDIIGEIKSRGYAWFKS
ncbi:putative reverse transcriptase zinc-binding domain-containing protein [Helianthus annuus]|nr:putative reverse transcriptase zinc-binding domain-containing protein [Helianthus annuus]